MSSEPLYTTINPPPHTTTTRTTRTRMTRMTRMTKTTKTAMRTKKRTRTTTSMTKRLNHGEPSPSQNNDDDGDDDDDNDNGRRQGRGSTINPPLTQRRGQGQGRRGRHGRRRQLEPIASVAQGGGCARTASQIIFLMPNETSEKCQSVSLFWGGGRPL